MHINRIKNNDNIKNTDNKLINKVHTENNNANSITKKTHLKIFNDIPKKVKSINNTHNVLKKIKQVNKVHTKTNNNTFIDLDKCKKAHTKLLINVLNQIKSIIICIYKNVQDIKTHLQILSMKRIFVILIMMYYYIITYYIMLVK